MIKYVIVEDERLASNELKRMMDINYPDFTCSCIITNTIDAIDFIDKNKDAIDLIFLDIQLADGLAFDIFEQIEVDIPVIFTTAYDQYALKAFRVNSIDYLLKPISTESLKTAITKFLKNNHRANGQSQIQELQKFYRSKIIKDRFLIQKGNGYGHINAAEIAFFYSEDKVVFLHSFSNERYIINYSIEQLVELLRKETFFQVSRSCITHINAIQKITKYDNSRLKLYFTPTCPIDILVSRKRMPNFLKWVDGILE